MLTVDNDGVSQTSYTFRKQFIVTSNASGQIVITAGTNETFNALSNTNYLISVLDDGSGGCNDGDVIAVTQVDGLTSVVVAGDSKTVTFTESLSRNNMASSNGPKTNDPNYELWGTASNTTPAAVVGYQSGNRLKNYDTLGNCHAIQIGASLNAGGVRDIYCVAVDMPPRKAPSSTPEYSILVEGAVTLSLDNRSNSSSILANTSIGVWATDSDIPSNSSAPAVTTPQTNVNAATPWLFGTSSFFYGGGLGTWPRAMHASYYSNLKESQVPGVSFNNAAGGPPPAGTYLAQFPMDWLNSQKTLTYTDPMGQPSSNGKAGNPNNGSPIRFEIDAGAYEIQTIPFSILCQNTNTTTSIQKQYIWVTISDLQSSGNFTLFVLRDGFYGFKNTTTNNKYGGGASCSVYYIGDPDITGTGADA